ncbi:hypothetical protein L9W92_17485 [Pelotomaculum terephthalicicum JT]|nr:hypothetical protein [Pelotomaculum terephthalicicum]MCG9969796.1 hypothetical protein [Pelotomaculum terephthalicicum JT]
MGSGVQAHLAQNTAYMTFNRRLASADGPGAPPGSHTLPTNESAACTLHSSKLKIKPFFIFFRMDCSEFYIIIAVIISMILYLLLVKNEKKS